MIRVTRVTHSCHLIEVGGATFLTDPWFSTRPTRYPGEPVAAAIGDLPELSGVLISHEHYDHCDLEAFAAYRDPEVPLVVPPTVARLAAEHGFRNVIVREPWQSTDIGGATVTAAPGLHGVYEITFVLQAGGDTVYFAGDAARFTAILEPDLVLPHHYAFSSGWLGNRLLTRKDTDPRHYANAAARLAPGTEVRIVTPGTEVTL
jgi:L-ascorbate metabolism protein UlaG (beta-lactamase superfamily)